ncbi:hypothetical protein BD413DRAFT_513491 [Trametes elegans]|nr:hypothetical protein BD413DRAFT_513491 [Trametes elegans]
MADAPRWLEAVKKAVDHPKNKFSDYDYQFATVDASGAPHVRTLGHRAFFHPNGRPDLPLLISATDVRTPKVSEIRANQRVEIAWWFGNTIDQFRLSGFVHLIPAPNAPGDASRTPIPEGAAALRALEAQGFDWEEKRLEVLKGMGPTLRGGWLAVPKAPGTPLASDDERKDWPRSVPLEPKTEEDEKHLERARSNFSLLVIEPIRVDWAELAVSPNRRYVFTRDGEKWSEQLVVP